MSLPRLKLVSFTLCPYVQRALILLIEKNAQHEISYIDLSSPPPWFYDISPLEKVPVLLVDDQALFESIPIIEYIDDITPGTLYPETPFERAQHKAWMEFINQILSDTYDFYNTDDNMAYKQTLNRIVDRLDTLEEIIDADTPYFGGEKFGMVDAVFATTYRYLSVLDSLSNKLEIFADTPLLKQWGDTLLARPSVQKSVPDSYSEEIIAYIKSRDSVFTSNMR